MIEMIDVMIEICFATLVHQCQSDRLDKS